MNQLNFRNVETLAQVTGSEAANRPAAATFSSQAPRNGAVKNISAQDTGEILDGSVWRKWSEKNGQNARDGKPATEYTGWDSHGNAHQRIRAPSTALSDDYGTARTPAGSSKFARIKVSFSRFISDSISDHIAERQSPFRQASPWPKPASSGCS